MHLWTGVLGTIACAGVHVYRCVFNNNVHICDILAAGVHIYAAAQLFQKFCFRNLACGAIFFIKNLETVCLRLSVPLSKIGTRTGASLSSIRKDRN